MSAEKESESADKSRATGGNGQQARKKSPKRSASSRQRGASGILPTGPESDSDRSWGDDEDSNDERLRQEKPPHW